MHFNLELAELNSSDQYSGQKFASHIACKLKFSMQLELKGLRLLVGGVLPNPKPNDSAHVLKTYFIGFS